MSLFGVQLNAQLNKLMLEARLQVSKQKFIPNIRTIYRSFATYDENMSGHVTLLHFQRALNQNGIFFKKNDFKIFQKAYQLEQNRISWFTFLSHLKESMSPVRRQLVSNIFQQLALAGEGKVAKQILIEHFNPQSIDLVQKKKMSHQKAFIQLIQMLVFNSQGLLTKDQFESFYDDLSLNFPSNEAFIRHVSQLWGYKYQKEKPVTQEQVKAALKALRYKLIQKSQGTKEQFLLQKLFSQYDENKNGFISAYELDLMLKDLELPTQPRLIQPLLIKLDKNKSGNIQIDEFKKFLFFDPFP